MKSECPRCKEQLDIDDANFGLNISCPTCQHEFKCPKPEPKEPSFQPIFPSDPKMSHTESKLNEVVKLLYVGLIGLPLLGGAFGYFSVFPANYEYSITAFSDITLETEMRKMGMQGWEMVSARRAVIDDNINTMAYEMIWKRKQ